MIERPESPVTREGDVTPGKYRVVCLPCGYAFRGERSDPCPECREHFSHRQVEPYGELGNDLDYTDGDEADSLGRLVADLEERRAK